MRALLKLFPARWRERYGDDFLAQLSTDPRRVTKLIDTVATAAALRWRTFHASGDGLAAALVGALTLTLGCDMALGVGMDERVSIQLLEHWWAAPFAALAAASVAIGFATLIAILGDPQRRRTGLALTVGIFTGSAAGSTFAAAISFDLAGIGAGVGLAIALTIGRGLLHTPLGRGDALVVVALPMIIMLGWRAASNPVGPLVLLIVAGALVATRSRPLAQ